MRIIYVADEERTVRYLICRSNANKMNIGKEELGDRLPG